MDHKNVLKNAGFIMERMCSIVKANDWYGDRDSHVVKSIYENVMFPYCEYIARPYTIKAIAEDNIVRLSFYKTEICLLEASVVLGDIENILRVKGINQFLHPFLTGTFPVSFKSGSGLYGYPAFDAKLNPLEILIVDCFRAMCAWEHTVHQILAEYAGIDA